MTKPRNIMHKLSLSESPVLFFVLYNMRSELVALYLTMSCNCLTEARAQLTIQVYSYILLEKTGILFQICRIQKTIYERIFFIINLTIIQHNSRTTRDIYLNLLCIDPHYSTQLSTSKMNKTSGISSWYSMFRSATI